MASPIDVAPIPTLDEWLKHLGYITKSRNQVAPEEAMMPVVMGSSGSGA